MEALLLGEQMAVGLILQFSGVDAAKYDAIVKGGGAQRQEGSGQRVSMGEIERPSIWRLEFWENPAKHVGVLGVQPFSVDDLPALVTARSE
jgi:hypothetical protein